MNSSSPSPARPPDPWSRLAPPLIDRLLEAFRVESIPVERPDLDAALDRTGGEAWDLALAVHRWARAAGRTPPQLAEDLAARLRPVTPPLQSAVAAQGYVNLTLDPETVTRGTLETVFQRWERYGHWETTDARACVEHTSANPTGAFHVGRVRNAIIGDTLVRVLRARGIPAITQYYVDDMGRQAAMITWIWSRPPEAWPPEIRAEAPTIDPAEKADRRLGRPYPAVSSYLKTHPEAQAEVAEIVRAIEEGRPPPDHRPRISEILDGMLASLARIGIRFDERVWESSLLESGAVGAVVERLAKAPHAVVEANGAAAIDATGYRLPKEEATIIFRRADGTSLYVTRDVAYHLRKFARFDRVIDVLGQDHRLHAQTLDALLAEIGERRRPEYVIYQDLTVPEGGRMSTRRGTGVWLDDLLGEAVRRAREEVVKRRDDLAPAEVERIAEAVGTSAVRYHILRVAPEKTVLFRWEEALSFEGRTAPFLQYAHARAASLLRRAGRDTPPYPFDPAHLGHPEERALLRRILALPGRVAYVARTTHVHALAGYAHDLADQFNRFYHAVPVLTAGAERESRIALVAAARRTMETTLDLIGVTPLETM
ncbi:MAG: arginine--tRNA ligase [Thermoplasmata archaeon]